jgi:glycosyltransferase involved in cell wall biosynthesis
MKIAIVGPFYPFRGGIAQFTSQMAEELSKNNELLCVNFIQQYPSLIFPGKTQFDESSEFLEIPSKRLLTPYNPFTFSKTANSIINFKPDLVIFNYWIPFTAIAYNFVAKQICKKIRTRVISITHNLESHEKWLLAEKMTKHAMKFSDAIVTLSKAVQENAEKLFPQKQIISAFHPTYSFYKKGKITKELARKALGFTDEKIVLFFGYIKQYKGLGLLLKSFPELLEKLPNTRLLIVGEVYGDAKQYCDLIDKLKIKNKVTFIREFVPNEEVEKYFLAADVLALPYKQATQSGVAQIAFSFGKGVVVTPVGGLPEIVQEGKTGIVANSMDPKDLASALTEFFKLDKTEINRYTLEESDKLSWQSFCELILE